MVVKDNSVVANQNHLIVNHISKKFQLDCEQEKESAFKEFFLLKKFKLKKMLKLETIYFSNVQKY